MNQLPCTPPPELITAAESGVIGHELLRELARRTSTSQPSLLNGLAHHVARQYYHGEMSYEVADRAMNAAYSLTVQEEYLAANDRTLPNPMVEVFEAFDAGEYHHHGDPQHIDPEAKYTRPMIEAYLFSARDDA
jgi:hypothetical protein